MNYKKYKQEIENAKDSYWDALEAVRNTEFEKLWTNDHVVLCRDLMRKVMMVMELESVDIDFPEAYKDALL